ncbi:hypothetical protein VTJ04DRAFT_5773 [Mycothermus thermophilus]|uniref:uncharacterized protein n=1 Tax=Humicola insolens TaxID=85995 RepID=UPI003741FC27
MKAYRRRMQTAQTQIRTPRTTSNTDIIIKQNRKTTSQLAKQNYKDKNTDQRKHRNKESHNPTSLISSQSPKHPPSSPITPCPTTL